MSFSPKAKGICRPEFLVDEEAYAIKALGTLPQKDAEVDKDLVNIVIRESIITGTVLIPIAGAAFEYSNGVIVANGY